MEPATSDWNFTPSATGLGSPPSTMAGVGLLGQIVVVEELTVMLSGAVAVSQAGSVTSTLKLEVPVAVGVPEITPVLVARVSPAGSVPLARTTCTVAYRPWPPVLPCRRRPPSPRAAPSS